MELQNYRHALRSAGTAVQSILIVDDVEMNRAILRSMFEEHFEVLEAADGAEALRVLAARENHVDLILLDLVMPGMDGPTFLACKNIMPPLSGIPVIIITSDDSEAQQRRTLAMGANDYIVKPFVAEIVQRRVANVLESRQSFASRLRAAPSAGQKAILLLALRRPAESEKDGVLSALLQQEFPDAPLFEAPQGSLCAAAIDAPDAEALRVRAEHLLQQAAAGGLECAAGAAFAAADDLTGMGGLQQAGAALRQALQPGAPPFVLYDAPDKEVP